MRQRLASLVAAVAAVAVVAAGAVVPLTAASPAAAAGGYCAKGSGVTVVVDTGALGGGTSIGCDGRGANTAGSTVVPRAGFSLTYVQKQPGFVCRVGGAPASVACGNTPPAAHCPISDAPIVERLRLYSFWPSEAALGRGGGHRNRARPPGKRPARLY